MATTTPALTQRGTIRQTRAQHIQNATAAMEKAQAARVRLADLKRHVRSFGYVASPLEAARVIREVPPGAARMEMGALLLSVVKMGKAKARPILAREGVSVWCTVAGMTPRQRDAIASELEGLAQLRRTGSRPRSQGRPSAIERAILAEIVAAGERGVTGRVIAQAVGLEPPPLVGTHLGALRKRQLIRGVAGRRGRYTWFVTDAGRMVR